MGRDHVALVGDDEPHHHAGCAEFISQLGRKNRRGPEGRLGLTVQLRDVKDLAQPFQGTAVSRHIGRDHGKSYGIQIGGQGRRKIERLNEGVDRDQALPVLREALGVSLLQAGFLLSLVQLAGMALGLAVGLVADSLGLRRTMLAGLFLLAGASALGAGAVQPSQLLALRAIEGMGFLLATMPAPGMIRRLVEPGRLSAALGMWSAFMPLGTALALLFGPMVIGLAGWACHQAATTARAARPRQARSAGAVERDGTRKNRAAYTLRK